MIFIRLRYKYSGVKRKEKCTLEIRLPAEKKNITQRRWHSEKDIRHECNNSYKAGYILKKKDMVEILENMMLCR